MDDQELSIKQGTVEDYNNYIYPQIKSYDWIVNKIEGQYLTYLYPESIKLIYHKEHLIAAFSMVFFEYNMMIGNLVVTESLRNKGILKYLVQSYVVPKSLKENLNPCMSSISSMISYYEKAGAKSRKTIYDVKKLFKKNEIQANYSGNSSLILINNENADKYEKLVIQFESSKYNYNREKSVEFRLRNSVFYVSQDNDNKINGVLSIFEGEDYTKIESFICENSQIAIDLLTKYLLEMKENEKFIRFSFVDCDENRRLLEHFSFIKDTEEGALHSYIELGLSDNIYSINYAIF